MAVGPPIRTYLKKNLSAPGGVPRIAGFSICFFIIQCIVNRLKMLTYYVYAPLSRRLTPCQEP